MKNLLLIFFVLLLLIAVPRISSAKTIILYEGGSDVYMPNVMTNFSASVLVIFYNYDALNQQCMGRYIEKNLGEVDFKVRKGNISRIPWANISCKKDDNNYTILEIESN